MLFGLRRKLTRSPGRELGAAWGDPSGQLSAVAQHYGLATLIHASGSVDAANVALWRRMIGEAAGATIAPGPLIIDADGLEFMAVCGYAELVEQSARCRRRGIELYLVSGQPVVARVMSVAALRSELSFAVSIDEVLGDPAE